MPSFLYRCRVMHHRFSPKRHRFVYGIFLLAIDLDELELLNRSLRFFSVGKRNLYSFREDDYFPTHQPVHNRTDDSASDNPPAPSSARLKTRVLSYLAQHGIDLSGGRVVLLTLPRVFGYLFNPVSFYFCYDRSGQPVASIAEVTNTFREVKPFLLGPNTRLSANPGHGTAAAEAPFHRRVPKHFYVSPYSSVEVSFDFTLRPPTEHLALQIDDYDGAERTLTSTLTGRQSPLTDAALASATLRHPLITLKIIGLIHWHALLLLAKRVPWFRKDAHAADQRNLYRPHASIASSS